MLNNYGINDITKLVYYFLQGEKVIYCTKNCRDTSREIILCVPYVWLSVRVSCVCRCVRACVCGSRDATTSEAGLELML